MSCIIHASINFDIEQINSLILQLSSEEKIELAKYIDKLTLKNRFQNFFDSISDIPISFDDITKEVENVREERYKYQSKNIK